PFKALDNSKIKALLKQGVFIFEKHNQSKHGDIRIFNSRMVQEVKGLGTDSLYEKSRLVIQGYTDTDKDLILI
ncbi:hypothetical protein K469DRAFT_553910, partial [Zopfia rhizophila CBS 207.26]